MPLGPVCRSHCGRFRQGGQGQRLAAQGAAAPVAVVALELGPGVPLRRAAQPVPAQRAAGVIDRRVRPAMRRLGARRIAGLAIGRARRGQAQGGELLVAGGQHPAQGRQIGFRLDQRPRRHQQHPGRQVAEALQPQPLGLIEQAGVGKGAVELVVIVDAEQREDLIDGIDQLRRRQWPLNRPSCDRRVLRGGRELACCPLGQAFSGFHAALPSLGC